jgi:hypothetical protein
MSKGSEGFWFCPQCQTMNDWDDGYCRVCKCPRLGPEERINDDVIDKLLRTFFELNPNLVTLDTKKAIKEFKGKIKKPKQKSKRKK